ncbi:MAG: hypothetical protein OEZ34_17090 [Spirochaetia bacterium]|nr:hypothetical protein [Spirochaetia bacterium]
MKHKYLYIISGVAGIIFIASLSLYAQAPRCKQGYVWREAYRGDYICVPPSSRSQAQNDNRYAKKRMLSNGRCVQGYVWREANRSDRVCVTPAIRSRTAAENRAHSSRVESSGSGSGKAVNIGCPVQTIDVQVKTRLPKEWWDTPQRGNLAGIDIQRIGGKPTLVCKYRAYGTTVSIMRKLPDGTSNCTKNGNQFRCQ